jgi:hypothetical protein
MSAQPTTAELAAIAFEKNEYVRALLMSNTPLDYEERKRAFVQLAEAQEAATVATAKLLERTGRP